jgi:hypothetical protein
MTAERAPHLIAEDGDPLFSALFIHLRSRHRAREVIKDLRSRGFVVVAENELRALRSAAGKPADDASAAGFSAAVLAATKNFG